MLHSVDVLRERAQPVADGFRHLGDNLSEKAQPVAEGIKGWADEHLPEIRDQLQELGHSLQQEGQVEAAELRLKVLEIGDLLQGQQPGGSSQEPYPPPPSSQQPQDWALPGGMVVGPNGKVYNRQTDAAAIAALEAAAAAAAAPTAAAPSPLLSMEPPAMPPPSHPPPQLPQQTPLPGSWGRAAALGGPAGPSTTTPAATTAAAAHHSLLIRDDNGGVAAAAPPPPLVAPGLLVAPSPLLGTDLPLPPPSASLATSVGGAMAPEAPGALPLSGFGELVRPPPAAAAPPAPAPDAAAQPPPQEPSWDLPLVTPPPSTTTTTTTTAAAAAPIAGSGAFADLFAPPPSSQQAEATDTAADGQLDEATDALVAASEAAAASLQRLTDMGFSEGRCLAALQAHGMDEMRALDALLMSGE